MRLVKTASALLLPLLLLGCDDTEDVDIYAFYLGQNGESSVFKTVNSFHNLPGYYLYGLPSGYSVRDCLLGVQLKNEGFAIGDLVRLSFRGDPRPEQNQGLTLYHCEPTSMELIKERDAGFECAYYVFQWTRAYSDKTYQSIMACKAGKPLSETRMDESTEFGAWTNINMLGRAQIDYEQWQAKYASCNWSDPYDCAVVEPAIYTCIKVEIDNPSLSSIGPTYASPSGGDDVSEQVVQPRQVLYMSKTAFLNVSSSCDVN